MNQGSYNKAVTAAAAGVMIVFVLLVLLLAWERRIMRKVVRHTRAQINLLRRLPNAYDSKT